MKTFVVEDNFLVVQEVERMLVAIGHTVVGKAATGQEALELIPKAAPDAVLMDIVLDETMDGLTCARRLRELYPCPIVLLTAHLSDEYLENAASAGIAAYLVKPANLTDLKHALALARARQDDLEILRSAYRKIERQKQDLEKALSEIQALQGILPMCARCKKIRNDQGFWDSVEKYFSTRTGATFSHGYCPECFEKEMARIRPTV